jgi:WD40 repeat protein
MSQYFDFFATICGYMQQWDNSSSGGRLLNQINAGGYAVRAFSLTSDSAIMVVSTNTCFITLDVDTHDRLQVFKGHVGEVWCVAISPDDLTVVSGGNDHKVMVWDLPTGKLKMTLTGHEGPVTSVAISPTGEKFASGSSDNTVRIWSLLDAGKLLFTLEGHINDVKYLFFIHGTAGQQIISGSADKSIRVWNVDDGVNVGTIDVGTNILSLAITSLGDKVVCGGDDKSVRVFNLHSQELIWRKYEHTNWVRGVAIVSDDRYIISGSDDGTIIKWMIESGLKMNTLTGDFSVAKLFSRPSALISDRNIQLKFSGRIVGIPPRGIVYTVNPQTRVDTRQNIVILLEEEIVITTIKTSDVAKAREWKEWIIAVRNNLRLPKGERLKTGTGIMNQYKSDCFQVMNITKSAKVDFLPKNAMNLVIHYIYK